MAQQGRIGGPLLADNLLRNGSNLAINTKVLYLDVVNKRVGFNTTTPVTDLYTPTSIGSTNLIVDNISDFGNFGISANQIQNAVSAITISPPVVVSNLSTSQLNFVGNSVKSLSNANIEISPNGTGVVNFNKDLNINADLHATGNITFDGNVQLGNQTTDTIDFVAEVNSSILPSVTDTYNLGSATNQWLVDYTPTFDLVTLSRATLTVNTLNSSEIRISGNNIYNSAGNNLTLSGNGVGFVNINGAGFAGNNIYTPTDNALTMSSTGTGYVKFTGTNGIVLPTGDNSNYPASPEVGKTRFNSDLGYPEVYDEQLGWIPISGVPITQDQVTGTAELWALILGL